MSLYSDKRQMGEYKMTLTYRAGNRALAKLPSFTDSYQSQPWEATANLMYSYVNGYALDLPLSRCQLLHLLSAGSQAL